MRLADHLTMARGRQFVGRDAERSLFHAALTAPALPFHVLYVFGPGGVGKTSLLRAFRRACDEAGIPAAYVDARVLDPSSEGFISGMRAAMDLPAHQSPLDALAARAGRSVVFIDTYESLAMLDPWVRETFLPQAPDGVLFVLAGRDPPGAGWRTDPGWQALLRAVSLRNLEPGESRQYLTGRRVPESQHQAVLDFTHGHPLALSLVADVFAQRPEASFQPESAPDVIAVLLKQLVQQVPGPAHRSALEACALVRVMTEPLLAAMLGTPDARELFDWLRGLSLIESDQRGLFPHDLAREALATDLRWRNPPWHEELHRRARAYYYARLQGARAGEQQRILVDYIFLHRDNPIIRPYFRQLQAPASAAERVARTSVVPEPANERDGPEIIELVAHHEGAESARLAQHWFARQRHGMVVFRSGSELAGFMALVALHQTTSEDREADPAVRAALEYLERTAPIRTREAATLFRFWMARDTYQAVSPIQGLIFVNTVRHYLTTPGLAFTFLPCSDPDLWAPALTYADLARIPEADFEMGGRRYGVYGHDWRVVPPMAWLDLLGEREMGAAIQQAPQPTTEVLVLSESAFFAAVQDGLRSLARPAVLEASPLLRSRLVLERAGSKASPRERASALRELIDRAIESLQHHPRDAKLYRALHHTYRQPAATQEQAAELLGLPFSTYRRHLTAGAARVAEMLWRAEVQA